MVHLQVKSYIEDGAKNVSAGIKFLSSQPTKVQEAAKKSMQTNAYFAHSSNLLLSMLADSEESIRQKAVNSILEIRNENRDSRVKRTSQGIRIFRIPELNWNATHFSEIIE